MANCGTILNPQTTDHTTRPEPQINDLGNGWFRVTVPELDIVEETSMFGLADVILGIAAIIDRDRGLLVTM